MQAIELRPAPNVVTANHHLEKTMLHSLAGLKTRYLCASCGQHLLLSNNFAIEELQRLVGNLTGSCPNCRHVFSFEPHMTRFLCLSA
jgi:DNA-directed RNA polymerase subunit RPC12/RpoP